MARLKGLIDFEGTLGGISVYTRDGDKRIARQAGGPSKDQIKYGANFVRTRENNSEFGGAVAAAKVLRQSLWPVIHPFVDASFTGRLQGEYQSMILQSEGIRGQRMFKPLQHVDEILNIIMHKNGLHLDAVLQLKPVISTSEERSTSTLSIQGFSPATDIHAPAGATHLELIYGIAVQPALEYDGLHECYKRSDGQHSYRMASASSMLIAVNNTETMDIELSAVLTDRSALHTESALVSVLGIRFHQQIGFKTYPMEMGKAMGFVGVS